MSAEEECYIDRPDPVASVKAGFAVVATLHQVYRHARQMDAGTSGHGQLSLPTE
jgi:hypothetical protein